MVYLPLAGPNTRGISPKACLVTGWNEPGYRGVDSESMPADAWLGLRLDGRVVVDCDCGCPKVNGSKPDVCATPEVAGQALAAWRAHIGSDGDDTWVRKTPHGFHVIYKLRTIDAGSVRSCQVPAISAKIDIKAGIGDQIVFSAPGYYDSLLREPAPFDPAWLPPVELVRPADEWSELPDGIGDSFMISLAGKLREWGADEDTIERCMGLVNREVMTRAPMKQSAVRRIARSAARYAPGERPDVEHFECPTCSTRWEGN